MLSMILLLSLQPYHLAFLDLLRLFASLVQVSLQQILQRCNNLSFFLFGSTGGI